MCARRNEIEEGNGNQGGEGPVGHCGGRSKTTCDGRVVGKRECWDQMGSDGGIRCDGRCIGRMR